MAARPQGSASERSLLGHPALLSAGLSGPASRALENVLHGVPKCTAEIRPDASQPRTRLRLAACSKSQLGPRRMSQARARWPRRRMAALSSPAPAKSSRKH
eukprot:3030494-Lingulodinium_polyedra.AAC.1